ncbi:MAG: hypothetical protein IPK37_17795 [Austwickia sp.]|jgi:hypothetical protein|nr:MAG: hypothetical protein IPK37_17795 [Austwickia sp.]
MPLSKPARRAGITLGILCLSLPLGATLASAQSSTMDVAPAAYGQSWSGDTVEWGGRDNGGGWSRWRRWHRSGPRFSPTPSPRPTSSPTSAPTTAPTSAPTTAPTSAPTTAAPSPSSQGPVTTIADRISASYTDPAGTSSTYHLFTSKVAQQRPVGVVVYLDGDGMYGHRNPSSTWALGGSGGVVAQAGARGYATLSIKTPSADGTFWSKGRVNAAYVAALIESIRSELGVQRTWLVGYSGGSQLITQYLLPAHSAIFAAGGGAVITGGGGAPSGDPTISAALKSGFPMLWYTGSIDDGRGQSDGYNGLADAKRGQSWYAARGFNATRQEPAGLDHEDLGTRFGTVLASQLDAYPAR